MVALRFRQASCFAYHSIAIQYGTSLLSYFDSISRKYIAVSRIYIDVLNYIYISIKLFIIVIY